MPVDPALASASAADKAEAAAIKNDSDYAKASPAAQQLARTLATQVHEVRVVATPTPTGPAYEASKKAAMAVKPQTAVTAAGVTPYASVGDGGCNDISNMSIGYNAFGNVLEWVTVSVYNYCWVLNYYGVWVFTTTPWSSYAHGEHLGHSWCGWTNLAEGWNPTWIEWLTRQTGKFGIYVWCWTTDNLGVGLTLEGDGYYYATY